MMNGVPSPVAVRDIHAVLRGTFGFTAFRPVQQETIAQVMAGRDTLALLPTGGGKSLCYQVPALAMGGLCLVVSPLVALMKDQVERLRALGVAARAVTSGMGRAEIDNALESAAVGRLSFLYVSPERLATELFLARLPRMPVTLIAVDEAHCISQWGYDFRPAYLNVGALRERLPGVPVLALTASATGPVVKDIMERLAFARPNVVRAPFHRPELVFWVARGEDKHGLLLRALQRTTGSAIVYLRDRRGTVRLSRFLNANGIPSEAYHAGMAGTERDRVQHAWTHGQVRCVAATNAFGMGIDKGDVRTVVHLDLPPDLESYYQEAGRAGRDGVTSHAILLLAPGDEARLRERTALAFPSLQEVRRVHQAFADAHGIAHGSGLHETYPIDLDDLARRTALRPATVAHALRTLELDGRLALSEGAHEPSRVLIVAPHATVHRIRVKGGEPGTLMEALLRLYGGLFEEPAAVDERRIANLLRTGADKVAQGLKALHQQEVIHYRPASDAPSATLLEPRPDSQRIQLSEAALSARKQRAMARMDAMIAYALGDGHCRARTLLAYFDEPGGPPCGQCDVCRKRKPHARHPGDGTEAAEPPVQPEEDAQQHRWYMDELGRPPVKANGPTGA